MPGLLSATDAKLSDYEKTLLNGDVHEDEHDTFMGEIKAFAKQVRAKHRKALIEDYKVLKPGDRFLGYGGIDDKHIDKETGKKLKHALAEDLTHQIWAYVMTKRGANPKSIESMLGGLKAMKVEKKDGRDYAVPDTDTRRLYQTMIEGSLDKFAGEGKYQDLIAHFANAKTLAATLNKDAGEIIAGYIQNTHADSLLQKDYLRKVSTDLKEQEAYKAHVGKKAGEKEYALTSSELRAILGAHPAVLGVTDPSQNPYLKKVEKKKPTSH